MNQADDQFSLGRPIPGTRYRVRALIGSGGMGSVYEVEHEELGKLFVLKALRARLAERSDLVARMTNEWRALARLQHPNIVLVTDAGRTTSGVPYYVMERLVGETLGARLRREGPWSVAAALRCCAGILDGLAAAHAIGIVHRDIKPQNVFLPKDGGVKLLDFGIAKLRDQASWVVTRQGVAIGTPKYMSPEQAEGKAVDGRADIYAVALVLFELLAGCGPFAGYKDPNDLVLAHISETPVRLDRKATGVPAEVADLVQRWLSKDPANRPLDAAIAAREIRRLSSSFGAGGAPSFLPPTVSVDYDSTTLAGDAPGGSALPGPSPRVGTSSTGGARGKTGLGTRTLVDGGSETARGQTTIEEKASVVADGPEPARPSSPLATLPVLPRSSRQGPRLPGLRWLGLAALMGGLNLAALLFGMHLGAARAAPSGAVQSAEPAAEKPAGGPDAESLGPGPIQAPMVVPLAQRAEPLAPPAGAGTVALPHGARKPSEPASSAAAPRNLRRSDAGEARLKTVPARANSPALPGRGELRAPSRGEGRPSASAPREGSVGVPLPDSGL